MENPIETYIASQNEDIQPILRQVRSIIQANLPDAEERFSYQMPTYWKKTNLIHFAAMKNHLGIYPGPEVIAHFAPIFKERQLRFSKGALQLPYDKVPFHLIEQIVVYIKETRVKA